MNSFISKKKGLLIDPDRKSINSFILFHTFLFNLIHVLKRGKITQWDRDNFNFSCKSFFDQFTEFVAFHYALSQRTDTPYWQDISNKSFYANRIIDGEVGGNLKLTMNSYMDKFSFFKSDAGIHYIGTGMNYLGTGQIDNEKEISPQLRHILQGRKNELKKWNNICKNEKSLLNFLKDTIYKI